jgi:hypothetical protein
MRLGEEVRKGGADESGTSVVREKGAGKEGEGLRKDGEAQGNEGGAGSFPFA